ncbi:MAG: DNA mismatch repair protein MutS, partial [Alphaproteobacteria bacterium]
ALGRLSLGRGGPRDLVSIREGLKAGSAIARRLAGVPGLPDELEHAITHLQDPPEVVGHLDDALDDEPPLLARDGGFVRKGHVEALDEATALRDDSRRHIAALQTRYQEAAGVPSLKVRHNNMLGYYVETTQVHADK